MFLRDSNAIRTAIHELVAGHTADEPIGLAVAFWGAGAEGMLPAGGRYQVICNLSMGGTNPKVIAQLMDRSDVEVRHLPDLHAKVVVGAGGAVVSSANFSANGLGMEGATSSGWQEAGVFIPAADAEFTQVYGWFVLRWRAASPVTTEVLELATRQWQAWAVDSPKVNEVAAVEKPTPTATHDSIPELVENELFQAKIKSGNAIRMAATWLVEEYERVLGHSLTTSEHYIPAYTAHVLWTASGKKIATGIKSTPEFWKPEQVVLRAKERSAAFPDRVRNLLNRLAESPRASDSVRYWAGRCVELKL